MKTRAYKFSDWAMLIACNAMWASQSTLATIAQSQGLGSLAATTVPVLLATVALVLLVWAMSRRQNELAQHPPRRITMGDMLGFVAIGILGQLAAQFSITWAVTQTTAANVALLFLALPIVTAVMALIILGERMTVLRWISFALAIAGAAVSSGIDWRGIDADRGHMTGNALAFVCIAASAFYNVYSKKLLEKYSPLEVLLGSYVVMIVFAIPITLYFEPRCLDLLARSSWKVWGALLCLAIFVYFAPILLFLNILSRIDAIQAGLSNYLIPIFGVAIAAVVLGQGLGMLMIAGGALVFLSTLLVTVAEVRQARQTQAPGFEVVPAKD